MTEEVVRVVVVRIAVDGVGGVDVYERVRADVLGYPEFRFNWFIKSRTPQELARRCHTLLLLVMKEQEEEEREAANKSHKKRRASGASPRPSSRARR